MKTAITAAVAALMLMLTFGAYAADYQGCPYAGSGTCPMSGKQVQRPARNVAPRTQRRATTRHRYTVGRTYRGYINVGVPGVRLNAEQQRRVASIRRDTQTRAREVMRNFKMTPTERMQRWNEIRRNGHDRVIGVLSPEQRARYQNWASQHFVGTRCGPGAPSAPSGG